jgi:hypothetical protein
MSSEPERGEWQSLVAAEQEVSKLRAVIYGLPRRAEVLADAISGSSVWDRTVALRFIREFPEDTPQLLDQLVDLAMSTGWARESIEAIRAARSEVDSTRMTAIVKSFLTDGDAEDYLRLAELAAQTEAWQALGAVIAAAATSDDPEKQEVARDFAESHGTMIPVNDGGTGLSS